MPWEVRSRIRILPIDDATQRRHYVDGQVNSSDVWIHPTPSTATKAANGSEWRSYLVGGLREGGRQYFALDITNPNGITPPGGGGALPYPGYTWEFPNEADAAGDLAFMGESWAQPIITKVRLKDPLDASKVVERWVAVVTAGYDPTSDPNPEEVSDVVSSYDATSTLGRGVYIIDIKTGGVLAEKKFGSAVDNQASMLFSTVASASVLDLNSDGFADTIYIVSMGGQVFKWSIADPGEDRINDSSGLRTQPNWPYKLFFEAAPATIGSGAGAVTYYKNFMFPPAAAYVRGKLFLAFGSGERRNLPFLGDPDATETGENNRFYVVADSDPYEIASPALVTITEADLTDFSGSDSAATFSNKGFFFSVADGEKFVTNVEIFSGDVIAASFTPTTDTDPCVARGNGTLYVFDLVTGEGHFEDGSSNPERSLSLGPGLPTDPKISIGVGGKKNKVVIEKSGADIEIIDEDNIDLNGATLYWREAD
jgi:type IV pilus assembly protein PilY1